MSEPPRRETSIRRIHDIFRAFDDGAPPSRLYTLLEEMKVNSEDAVSAIIQGFECKEWRAHLAATKALGNAAPFAALAVPALIEALAHDESSVWEAAAESLGRIGPAAEPAVPALLAKLKVERDYGAENLVEALGHIGKWADLVVPILAGLIDDERMGAAACRALGGFPEHLPRLFAPLRDALSAPDWSMRVAAAEALVKHRPTGPVIDAFVRRILDQPEDARHLVPHLAALNEEHDRIVLTLVRVLEPFELEPLMHRFTGHRRLAELLKDRQTTIRRRAAVLARDKSLVPSLISVLEDVSVAPAAIDALGRLGDGEAANALELYRAPNDDLRDRARFALRRLGRTPAIPQDGVDASRLRQVCIPPFAGEHALLVDGKAWFAWHRILESAPQEEWKTDSDEFGIGVIDIAAANVETWTLPIGFPIQPTGGAGAKRRWRLEFRTDQGLVCVLQDPFADQRGWGNDNYVYAFRDGWHRYDGKSWSPVAWAPRENPQQRVCGGELVAWKAAQGQMGWAADCTPYHLDDWEFTDEIRKAFEQRDAFAAGEPRMHASVVSADLWIVDGEPHRERPLPSRSQRRIYGAANLLGEQAYPVAAVQGVVFTTAIALVG